MTAEAPAGKISAPAHVRPESIVDFDLFGDPRFIETGDMHAGLHRLGMEKGQGVFWTPRNGGHWLINDYELLFEAVRRPDIFSSRGMTVPPMPEEPLLIPLGLDPPTHGAFRLPLMKAFSPEVVRAMEPDIRSFAASLIQGIARDGRCEFVRAVGVPMPVMIFMKLMGMPLDRLDEFREWVLDMSSNDDGRRAASYAKCHALMGALIRERQEARKSDLISFLIDADVGGRPPSFDELQAYCMLLFAAGLDTVANSLSFGVNHLAGNPALQDRLRSNPELIPEAVEEFLRRFGITSPPRTATRDVVFGGVEIKKGERVVMMAPAANFDPKIFPDPMAFDLERENKVHLTFHSGPHRCAGSHLARLELKIFYEEWLKRMPNIRHDPTDPVVLHMSISMGLKRLPIIWDMPPEAL